MPGGVVVNCRHMEPHQNSTTPDAVAVAPTFATVSRDPAPVAVPTPPPVTATVPRHLFTLTVDQVAAELFHQGFARDDRTIQRWCKAGKLRAIIDEVHGDRYLIDPASLRDMLTMLVTERDSRAARPFLSSRPFESAATSSRPVFDNNPTHENFSQGSKPDTRPGEDPAQPRHDASESDEVATLKRRIDELEKDKMMLTVDKQVREQMVDYLKEQFGSMLDQALDRSQEVGQLRAENVQLRAQLPPPKPKPEWGEGDNHRFTPQHVRAYSGTSGHPFRRIRPPVTRCHEAAFFGYQV